MIVATSLCRNRMYNNWRYKYNKRNSLPQIMDVYVSIYNKDETVTVRVTRKRLSNASMKHKRGNTTCLISKSSHSTRSTRICFVFINIVTHPSIDPLIHWLVHLAEEKKTCLSFAEDFSWLEPTNQQRARADWMIDRCHSKTPAIRSSFAQGNGEFRKRAEKRSGETAVASTDGLDCQCQDRKSTNAGARRPKNVVQPNGADERRLSMKRTGCPAGLHLTWRTWWWIFLHLATWVSFQER